MSKKGVRLTKKPAAVPGSEYDLDALRLLRLVRLRRALRVLVGLGILAVIVWGAYSLSLEAYYDEGSTNWQRIDDETGPGFVVIFVALAAVIVAFIATGRIGRHGRISATMVPGFNTSPEPAVRPKDAAPALRARLRRRGFVSGVAVGLVLLFGLLAVMSGTSAWPAWQANHGHGGRVITIDKYDFVTSHDNGPRPDTWILGTGEGTAVAESGRPRIGQKWTVGRDAFGNLRAYRVGGYDYLLVGGLFLLSLAIVVAAVVGQGMAVRTELRLRRAAGDHDLAADVTRLAAGTRPTLLLDGAEVGVLGLPERAGVHAARTLLVRRLTTAGLTAVVVVGLIVLLVVQQLNLLSGPPFKRDVQLPYLARAGWGRVVEVQYRFQDSNIRDLREWAGPARSEVTGVRDLSVRAVDKDGYESGPEAEVVVARVGSASPSRLTAGWRAHLAELRTLTPVSGLPAGWTAEYTRFEHYGDAEFHAFWASDGVSVEVSMDDGYYDGGAKSYTRSQLTAFVASLATALSGAGADRLEKDTARPEHV